MTSAAGQSSPDSFPTTRWTLIQVAQSGTSEEMAQAMEEICRRYWRPVFSFLIHSGRTKHDAEDLTQALFEKIISEEALMEARRERGRLRSYMLGMLRRVISRKVRHTHAEKRGGLEITVSLDEVMQDGLLDRHLVDHANPDYLYNRLWARQVMNHTRDQLSAAFAEKKRSEVFEAVAPYLTLEEQPPPYRELAATLNSTEAATRQLLHRLRKKFHELLEQEVARTVMRPEDVAEEMEWLRKMVVG
jgi:RNA polymerase sigma factor (sigma-70 family)